MVLLVIAIGLWAIGAVGYRKLTKRIISLKEVDINPALASTVLNVMSFFWPIALFITLMYEAAR